MPQSPSTTEDAYKLTACQEYADYAKYAQELQEAYHSRASQNRAWIYVAGVLALGAIAASGGLAAAGAAALGTIALINISGGFSAGVFATIDNSTLAEIYTISATAVDTARDEAAKILPPAPYTDYAACKDALDLLRNKVSEARSNLEEARTNSAKAAVMRAAAQQEGLRKQIEALGLGFDVSEPTKKELGPADVAAVTITGGKPPYYATPVGPGLEIVTEPTKANKYIAQFKPAAKGAANGEHTIIFRDSGGSWKSRSVTVKGAAGSSGAPATPAAKDLTVAAVPNDGAATIPNQLGRSVVFHVSGGTGKYVVGPLDANSQGGAITLQPAAGQPVGEPQHITVTLTEKAQPGGKYGASVRDDAGKTKPFVVVVASDIRLTGGSPDDGLITLTEGERRSVGISGGIPEKDGYTVAAPDAPPKSVSPLGKTLGPLVIDSTGGSSGPYKVTVKDSFGQVAQLTIKVIANKVIAKPVEVTENLVRKVQQALVNDRRCDPKGIDGIMGPNTKKALKCFQKGAKLSESGEIDLPTLKALGVS